MPAENNLARKMEVCYNSGKLMLKVKKCRRKPKKRFW